MSSKRHIKRKSCTGKLKFNNELEALNQMHGMLRKRGSNWPMKVYKCKFCSKYHYGHKPEKRVA